MNGSPLPLSKQFLLQPCVEDVLQSLHTCRKNRDLEQAFYLLVYICSLGLEADRIVGNNLVSMLAELGHAHDAQLLFDKQCCQSERAWTSLIAAYTEIGKPEQAFGLFCRLQDHGSVQPIGHTFMAMLRACSKFKDAQRGRAIHAEVMRMGLAERDPFVGSALVDMYAKLGLLQTAQEVLDWLPVQDVVSCTALISGYADCGQYEGAIECLRSTQEKGFTANMASFVCCLKACSHMGGLHKGQELHAELETVGLSSEHVILGTALVDMYCKHGLLADAQNIFDKLSVRNAVSWTSLVAGYTEHGCSDKALLCYEKMLADGISADHVALTSSLKACGKMEAIEKGEDIHAEIERRGLLDTNVALGNTLVDMYAKCGNLSKAHEVFDRLHVRSVVSWTTLLAAYADRCNMGDNVSKLLECMQLEGVLCDAVALLCTLQSCSTIGAVEMGLKIHAEIERKSLLQSNPMVGNALVDMYAKHGAVLRACEVFGKLSVRDVVSWTSLIAGHAELGETNNVCRVFESMVNNAVKPDSVTFIVVLNCCSRSGLCDTSEMLYDIMNRWFGISPTLSHHTGMVGLFCRAGILDKAMPIIEHIPACSNSVIWHIVLDACKKLGNIGLGLQAFRQAMLVDERDAGAYMSISHIYADALSRQRKMPVS